MTLIFNCCVCIIETFSTSQQLHSAGFHPSCYKLYIHNACVRHNEHLEILSAKPINTMRLKKRLPLILIFEGSLTTKFMRSNWLYLSSRLSYNCGILAQYFPADKYLKWKHKIIHDYCVYEKQLRKIVSSSDLQFLWYIERAVTNFPEMLWDHSQLV